MSNDSFIEIPATPSGCSYRNDSLSFVDYGDNPSRILLLLFKFILAILYGVFLYYMHSISQVYTDAAVKSHFSLTNWGILALVTSFLILIGLFPAFYYLIFYPKNQFNSANGSLDKNGFHYFSNDLGNGSSFNTESITIPLSRIVKFRLQNDDSGVFVEVVTSGKAFHFYHRRFGGKNGIEAQRWLVATGNAVLSYLTGQDCQGATITENSSSCTLARLKRNEIIDNVETPQTTRWNVKAESNSIQLSCGEKCPSGSYLSSLLKGLFLIGLSVCSLIVLTYFILSRQTLPGNQEYAILYQIASFFVATFLLVVGVVCFLKAIPGLFSKISLLQWTLTDKTAIRKRKLFGILYARRNYDLTSFSYMEIQEFCSFAESIPVYEEESGILMAPIGVTTIKTTEKRSDRFQIILFDSNDRIILEINDLELNEAVWIANEIQKVIKGSAPNPIYRSLA